MPDRTYRFYAVYNLNGKPIPVDLPKGLPKTQGRQIRIGYPFHILKKKGDCFIIKDLELSNSLRSQASKSNANMIGKRYKLKVTTLRDEMNIPTGLLVTRA